MENIPNKYITVSYELYITENDTENMVERASTEHPFRFISGMGTTLEAFEKEIAPLAKGDKFDFVIPVAEAYGEYDETHVLDLPRNIFEIDGKFDSERIFAGNIVPLMNADGNRLNGTVVEVKENVIVMDFNHPFAGKDLHFKGEVTESRVATNAEIQEVACMPSEGCGGRCDCCGGGCGNSGCNEHGHHYGNCGCGCHD